MNIKFSPPDISDLEIQEVSEALKSGWITTGPRVKKLEKLIADYVGTPKCVCLNSQTACAEMALRILGIGEGDEVITSAYTYTASASVVCHVGAKLKLVDTLKDSLEPDYNALEEAITERTKAIIPIDLGGVPCDYDRIFEIVNKKKNLFKPNNDIQKALGRVAVLADTAHAFGAAASRNWALREATGKWIAFLDSDDLWLPEKLEKQLAFMTDNGYKFSYTAYEHVDEKTTPLNIIVTGPNVVSRKRMFRYCYP